MKNAKEYEIIKTFAEIAKNRIRNNICYTVQEKEQRILGVESVLQAAKEYYSTEG